MAFFNWTEDFSVGVNQMDSEHKNLISIMNRLFEENESGASTETLLATLDQLGQATVDHFCNEELFMESQNYEKIEVHKRIHKDLLEKFGRHLTEYKATGGRLGDGLFKFLSFWLSAHIRGIDKQYGPNGVDILVA